MKLDKNSLKKYLWHGFLLWVALAVLSVVYGAITAVNLLNPSSWSLAAVSLVFAIVLLPVYWVAVGYIAEKVVKV